MSFPSSGQQKTIVSKEALLTVPMLSVEPDLTRTEVQNGTTTPSMSA